MQAGEEMPIGVSAGSDASSTLAILILATPATFTTPTNNSNHVDRRVDSSDCPCESQPQAFGN
jgi:hypothetical protein